jgi:hypothetical protein
MPMVFVRCVLMGMLKGCVPMLVGVRLAGRIQRSMLMLMVLIMRVCMIMRQGVMDVQMFVMLGDVQPDAYGHQRCGDEKLGGQRLAERKHGGRGAEEGRGREIGTGPRRAEMTQRQHEQRQAGTIAQHPDESGKSDGARSRQRTAHPQSQGDVAGARDQPLQLDDLQGVGKRDLPRQVVVEPPRRCRR